MSAAGRNGILLVGAGRMGLALLKGWLGAGIGPIVVVEPRPSAELRKLARAKSIALVPSPPATARISTCVVAVKPQILKDAASSLAGFATPQGAQPGTLMISIAAGTHTASLRKAWGTDARIVRAMPNTPGAIGAGITGLFAGKGVGPSDRRRAEALLKALGETVWVAKEDLIDAVTAVSGSGPAYLFLMAEALAEAGMAEGLPRPLAEKLARATVAGAGALLAADPSSAAVLRQAVTSPGGTTEAALKVLMARDGLTALMKCAVRAARRRSLALR